MAEWNRQLVSRDYTQSSYRENFLFYELCHHITQYYVSLPKIQAIDLSVLAELKPQIVREMPEDEVAKEMYLEDLLAPNEWKEYQQMKKDIKKYLLDCLSHREAGFLDRFCSILRKPSCHAESLAKQISHKKQHGI